MQTASNPFWKREQNHVKTKNPQTTEKQKTHKQQQNKKKEK